MSRSADPRGASAHDAKPADPFAPDLPFFNGKAAIDFTQYRKQSDDLILTAALAPSTGFTAQVINGGQLVKTEGEIWRIQAGCYTGRLAKQRHLASHPAGAVPAGSTELFGRRFPWSDVVQYVIWRKRVLSLPRSSASARNALLASSSAKPLSDGKAAAAAQVAVPGPAPTSSRLVGAKSGLMSRSAFRLAVTAARNWRYQPATLAGVAVKYRKSILITVAPREQ